MYSGSEFQMEEEEAGKARLPTVESLTDGTMRRLVAAACERSQVSRRATVKNSVTKHGDLVCKKTFLRFLFSARFLTFFNVFYFANVFYF